MKKRVFQIALLLSLSLHFGFAAYLYLKKSIEPSKPEFIEIAITDAAHPTATAAEDKALDLAQKQTTRSQREKQIVQQNDQSVNEEAPKKDAFLSAKNQTVKEETRSLLSGKFNNSGMSGKGVPSGEDNAKPKEHISKTAKALQLENEGPTKPDTFLPTQKTKTGLPTLYALKPKFKWNDESQELKGFNGVGDASQTSDYLKNTKTGNQTLLNTREFVYYTYYNRIRAQLEQYWGPKIKEKVRKIFAQGRKIASDEDHITRVLITLDKKGTLVNVQVVNESGVRDLDEAAIEAFRAAAPFPNPPLGIVEKDGTIKIRWDFVIEA